MKRLETTSRSRVLTASILEETISMANRVEMLFYASIEATLPTISPTQWMAIPRRFIA